MQKTEVLTAFVGSRLQSHHTDRLEAGNRHGLFDDPLDLRHWAQSFARQEEVAEFRNAPL